MNLSNLLVVLISFFAARIALKYVFGSSRSLRPPDDKDDTSKLFLTIALGAALGFIGFLLSLPIIFYFSIPAGFSRLTVILTLMTAGAYFGIHAARRLR